MQYSRLVWAHASPAEPVEILSEYDESGWERRKVEKFHDGSLRFAGETETSGGSQLSLIRRPPDEDVVEEPEFTVATMTQSEFETVWDRARSLRGVA
jgi:hypothetical protein